MQFELPGRWPYRTSRVLMLALLTAAISTVAQARGMKEILQEGLNNDPATLEAQANERVAESRLAQSKASRWPTVVARGNQTVVRSGGGNRSFDPALQAKWTVYDFGKRAAQIKRDEVKTAYFSSKTAEAKEEFLYEIAGHYLDALKAEMLLEVAQRNLDRHKEIGRKIGIIVEYDPGRRSEMTQAQGRLLQVRESMANNKRAQALALSRLSRYVSPPVKADELKNPFASLTPDMLYSRYPNANQKLEENPSYIAQKQELESLQAELEAAKLQRRPDINLLGEARRHDSTVYLTFTFDLLDRTKAPTVDEKRYQVQAAQARLEKIKNNLLERAEVAMLEMREDQSRIDIADSQIKTLTQVTRDYEDQFEIAQRSLLDVLNSYNELATIEQLKVEATYDLMKAKLDYLSAAGKLAEWAGIELDVPQVLQAQAADDEGGRTVQNETVTDEKDAAHPPYAGKVLAVKAGAQSPRTDLPQDQDKVKEAAEPSATLPPVTAEDVEPVRIQAPTEKAEKDDDKLFTFAKPAEIHDDEPVVVIDGLDMAGEPMPAVKDADETDGKAQANSGLFANAGDDARQAASPATKSGEKLIAVKKPSTEKPKQSKESMDAADSTPQADNHPAQHQASMAKGFVFGASNSDTEAPALQQPDRRKEKVLAVVNGDAPAAQSAQEKPTPHATKHAEEDGLFKIAAPSSAEKPTVSPAKKVLAVKQPEQEKPVEKKEVQASTGQPKQEKLVKLAEKKAKQQKPSQDSSSGLFSAFKDGAEADKQSAAAKPTGEAGADTAPVHGKGKLLAVKKAESGKAENASAGQKTAKQGASVKERGQSSDAKAAPSPKKQKTQEASGDKKSSNPLSLLGQSSAEKPADTPRPASAQEKKLNIVYIPKGKKQQEKTPAAKPDSMPKLLQKRDSAHAPAQNKADMSGEFGTNKSGDLIMIKS